MLFNKEIVGVRLLYGDLTGGTAQLEIVSIDVKLDFLCHDMSVDYFPWFALLMLSLRFVLYSNDNVM